MGYRMEFLYAALDFSHPDQDWYKDCYAASGISTTRTAYMHFDADHDVMKAMLYLREVGPENGPFKYVRGSHLWKRSTLVGALQSGFDRAQTNVFEMEDDRLDYKLGYYRPRFKLPDHRADMLTLPALVRGSTHFGDDILDGSKVSDDLLQLEQAIVGPAGTMVIFDGSRGIHRGSQVSGGERWAVQIGMRGHRVARGPFHASAGAVRAKLSYQYLRARGVLHGFFSSPVDKSL
jgi:hypothetical protein